MPAFALDSNCMIAAVSVWHERHRDALAAIEKRLNRGDRMIVAAHALLESYAVLTRLPAPYRLSPADAWALIKESFVANGTLAALPGDAHVTLLDALASADVAGGRSYDALIARTAIQAKADELLTLNPRDFDTVAAGLAVVDPGA